MGIIKLGAADEMELQNSNIIIWSVIMYVGI